jgi:hypothetical protein
MTVEFKPAVRENVPLLIGVAGGTGAGKTMSALLLARGLAGGEPFAGIDTENGRMSIYADAFPELRTTRIDAPFRPEKYLDAIEAAERAGFAVVVVDSASHEWYGDGGCLDWHDEIMRGDQSRNLMAWIEPKKSHKRFVTRLLQVRAHVILCFRAEPKVEAVKVEKNGRTVTEIQPKRVVAGGGLDGWIPIAEKGLPYELTTSFLLMADAPGVPKPIKLPEPLKTFVPLDRPLTPEVGRELAAWAAGATHIPSPPAASEPTLEAVEKLEASLLERGRSRDREDEFRGLIAATQSESLTARWEWLVKQIARFETPAEVSA